MDRRAIAPEDRASALASIVERLEAGESLNVICAGPDMPTRRTVQRWCGEDRDLADQLYEAREAGYHARAERAVAAAKTCADPIAGRLAFDAERWYLGKLSNAFAERAPRIDSQTNVQVNLNGDGFGSIADLLDGAARGVASRAIGTSRVAGEGEAGPDSPAG